MRGDSRRYLAATTADTIASVTRTITSHVPGGMGLRGMGGHQGSGRGAKKKAARWRVMLRAALAEEETRIVKDPGMGM